MGGNLWQAKAESISICRKYWFLKCEKINKKYILVPVKNREKDLNLIKELTNTRNKLPVYYEEDEDYKVDDKSNPFDDYEYCQ
ncbi:unnamed protein product [Rhizophagus irregularis]|nr:unnamed protein product [Rhizophagus irregularis]